MGSKFRWEARQVTGLAAPFLHHFLYEWVHVPEGAVQGKALGARRPGAGKLGHGGVELVIQAPRFSQCEKCFTSLLPGQEPEDRGLRNIKSVLARLQGTCGQPVMGETGPP